MAKSDLIERADKLVKELTSINTLPLLSRATAAGHAAVEMAAIVRDLAVLLDGQGGK